MKNENWREVVRTDQNKNETKKIKLENLKNKQTTQEKGGGKRWFIIYWLPSVVNRKQKILNWIKRKKYQTPRFENPDFFHFG